MDAEPGYDGLVLQGGGCRCFFTLGFLQAAAPALTGLREIAAVSASSAMACAHVVGVHQVALESFAGLVRRNRKNFYKRRLLLGQRPTPHLHMYRSALRETFLAHDPQLQRLRAGPRVRILLGVGPGRSRALAVGLAALSVLRGRTPRWLGSHVLDSHDLRTLEELVHAVLSSSAFPPFTPLPRLEQRAVVDGGAVEPIPLGALSPQVRRPLLVLTRPRPTRPLPPGLALVAPREPLRVATWDYADEAALRRVYEEGLRTGERFLRDGAVARS